MTFYTQNIQAPTSSFTNTSITNASVIGDTTISGSFFVIDSDGNTAIWVNKPSNTRILYDSTSSPSIDWELRQLSSGNSTTINYGNYQLINAGNYIAVDWEVGELNAGNATSVDWINRELYDENGNLALQYTNTGSNNTRLYGTASLALTASLAPNYTLNSATGSFVTTSSFNNYTSSVNNSLGTFITTGSFGGTQTITGSLIVTQNLTVFNTASYVFVTASQLDVGTNVISVNVAEPAQRFGGLVVYDSGSLSHQATASLLWDSQNNYWIYQNASGSTYSGGMLMSGPRNTGSLGDERAPAANYILKGQGGDHMIESSIYDDGTKVSISSSVDITGSLNFLNGGVTGSLFGTSSWATNALTASFAPNYVLNSATSSMTVASASWATSALTSSRVIVTNTTTGTLYYPTFVSESTGDRAIRTNSGSLSYNANTNTLTVTSSWATSALTASSADTFTIRNGLNVTGSVTITGSTTEVGPLTANGTTTITGSVLGNVTALSIASNTASLNLSTGNFFTLQLVAGTNTYINPSNISLGQTVNVLISTTGSATVSFPSTVKQPSGSSYVPTTTTSKDVITLVSFDATNLYLAYVNNLI